MISRVSSPPLHKKLCLASDSLRKITWQKWTGKEGIFPSHHEPTTRRQRKYKLLTLIITHQVKDNINYHPSVKDNNWIDVTLKLNIGIPDQYLHRQQVLHDHMGNYRICREVKHAPKSG